MRTLGVAVAILGMALLAFIAMDAVPTAIHGAFGQATARENGREFLRLIFWTTFLGVMALATLASGIGDVVMSRRNRNPALSPRAPNGETAAMSDAEVNEGGPPPPETCPAPDRNLHLPLGKVVGGAKSVTLMK